MSAHLASRLFALMLVLSAGTAAAAPPCLDLVLGEEDCAGGEADHGCEDGCCDEEGCAADCSDCPCCPLRAPATFAAFGLRAPTETAAFLDLSGRPAVTAREPEGVFRPPRTPLELS